VTEKLNAEPSSDNEEEISDFEKAHADYLAKMRNYKISKTIVLAGAGIVALTIGYLFSSSKKEESEEENSDY